MSASDASEITRILSTASRDLLQVALQKKPACINQVNRFGFTLLHEVVRARNLDAVALLLFMGANPNALTKAGESPLYFAVQVDSVDIVDILLCYNADYLACQKDYDRTSARKHLFATSVRAFHPIQ